MLAVQADVLFGEFSADRWWICLDITTEQVY
jgi:hypothetical protein